MHGAHAFWRPFLRRAGGPLIRAACGLALLPAFVGAAASQPAEREIEAAALYMPNLNAEPGQRLRTRTAIGCFRHGANDYRCLILGLRMQGAMIVAPRAEPATQAYLDRFCRGRRSGLDYQECRFRVTFAYGTETLDTAENLRVYRTDTLTLDSDYLRLERTPPSRGSLAPMLEDKRTTGSIAKAPRREKRAGTSAPTGGRKMRRRVG